MVGLAGGETDGENLTSYDLVHRPLSLGDEPLPADSVREEPRPCARPLGLSYETEGALVL